MSKVALLIGVSQCQSSLNPLRWVEDVAEMARVLKSSAAGFEFVDYLREHSLPETMTGIEHFLGDRQPTDQIFLLYAGYCIQDRDEQLYLATADTTADSQGKLIPTTALSVRWLRQALDACPARPQVVVLDGCFRDELRNQPVRAGDWADPWSQLGGEGRVLLTAANPSQPWNPQVHELTDPGGWSYTRYLAEGIETGAADPDSNGTVTAADLHDYAARKLAIAAPALELEIQGQAASQVFLTVPIQSTADRYRRVLEQQFQQGVGVDSISLTLLGDRAVLRDAQQTLGLSQPMAIELESQTLRPIWEYRQRLRCYREKSESLAAAEGQSPEAIAQELQKLQHSLGLSDGDVSSDAGSIFGAAPVIPPNLGQPEFATDDDAPWYERPVVGTAAAAGGLLATGLTATGLASALDVADQPAVVLEPLAWESEAIANFTPITENSLEHPDEPVLVSTDLLGLGTTAFGATDFGATDFGATDFGATDFGTIGLDGTIDPDGWAAANSAGLPTDAEALFRPDAESLISDTHLHRLQMETLPPGEPRWLAQNPPRDPNRLPTAPETSPNDPMTPSPMTPPLPVTPQSALPNGDLSATDIMLSTDPRFGESQTSEPQAGESAIRDPRFSDPQNAEPSVLPGDAPTKLEDQPAPSLVSAGGDRPVAEEPRAAGGFPIVALIIGGLAITAGIVGARLAGWGNAPLFAQGGKSTGSAALSQKFNTWGLAKANQGFHQQAIAEYDKAVEADPNNALSYVNRGVAQAKLGNDDAALRDYNRAIELNPKLAYAYSNRSRLYYARKDYKKAMEDANIAVTHNARLPEAYINLANARSVTGDFQGALEDYNRAIQLNPPKKVRAGVYNNRGNVLLAMKNANGAVQNYNRALALQPELADSFFNRGLAFQFSNNKNQAMEDFRAAARLYQDQGQTKLQEDAARRVTSLQGAK
jgi:Tfp pilus assembly protein PilF